MAASERLAGYICYDLVSIETPRLRASLSQPPLSYGRETGLIANILKAVNREHEGTWVSTSRGTSE